MNVVTKTITMSDGRTITIETGKQAKLLNELVEHLMDSKFPNEEKLKEFVGHTPLQVVCGAVVGAVVALLVDLTLFS